MVSTRPSTSKSSSPFSNPLVTVPNAPVIIIIIIIITLSRSLKNWTCLGEAGWKNIRFNMFFICFIFYRPLFHSKLQTVIWYEKYSLKKGNNSRMLVKSLIS